MRVTLGDLRNSLIPGALGWCPTDSRLVPLVNEATERLLRKGKWWGTAPRFRICICDGCVTLPRAIAAIELVAVCGRPVPVHDQWFEFLENGAGIACPKNCDGGATYLDRFPAFSDICGLDKKVAAVCDLASDIGKPVLVLGFDANNNWIRTEQNGVIRDGEVIALAQGAGTNSVNLFSCVTDIQAPDGLDGQWWLYEYNTTALTTRMIGQYQYDEIRPSYARYRINGILNSTRQTMVDIVGKLDFIPVKNDTDYLILGNLPALKELMVAINDADKEADGMVKKEIVQAGTATAMQLLDEELSHYLGDGRRIGITVQGSHVDWGGEVANLV